MESKQEFMPGKVNEIHRLPLGVISSIAPFNFPLYLSLRGILPALALGNAVVHKADIQVGIVSGSLIAKAFEEAGIPKGVFTSLLTTPQEIGDMMLEDPRVKLIALQVQHQSDATFQPLQVKTLNDCIRAWRKRTICCTRRCGCRSSSRCCYFWKVPAPRTNL